MRPVFPHGSIVSACYRCRHEKASEEHGPGGPGGVAQRLSESVTPPGEVPIPAPVEQLKKLPNGRRPTAS